MDFTLILLTSTMFWKLSWGVRCYRCVPERSIENTVTPLCEHFDGSEQYIIECEFSTICYKKETSLRSLEADTRSTERGCALQTRDDEQVKIRGRWEYVKPIHEVYSATCEEDSNESGRPTRTMQCYCRGDLCNTAHGTSASLAYIVAVVLMRLVL